MTKTIWLSYDLGVRGDYSGLYKWLDNVDAVECGESIACIRLSVPANATVPDYVAKQLTDNVSFSKSDRVYVIWRNEESDTVKGRFIVGKRKSAPWTGYGDAGPNQDDL